MFYRLIILILLLSFNEAFAHFRNLSTTRLISTGGAGVASILMTEAAVLNPASIAFFNKSGFYYEKWNSHLIEKNKKRTDKFNDGRAENYIISDTSSGSKGTFNYQYYNENGFKRTRFGSSLSNPLSKKTAMGLAYRYTMDTTPTEHITPYGQVTLGFTHVYNQNLTLGAVFNDVFKAKKRDGIGTLGIQYGITSFLYLIGDLGSNYHYGIEKNSFNRLAAQFKLYKNLFARGGVFYDKNLGEKGNAFGFSFIGPKLSLEYAYKKAQFIHQNTDYMFKGESFEEMSLSLSIII